MCVPARPFCYKRKSGGCKGAKIDFRVTFENTRNTNLRRRHSPAATREQHGGGGYFYPFRFSLDVHLALASVREVVKEAREKVGRKVLVDSAKDLMDQHVTVAESRPTVHRKSHNI